MPTHRMAAAVLLALVASTAVAADAGDGPSRKEQVRTYLDLRTRLVAAFRDGLYDEALTLCDRQAELLPDRPEPVYNAACALARLGRTGEALDRLARAIDLGYADPDHMKADPDLAAVRDDDRFATLLAKARAKAEARPYEKGAALPGVRTVEGLPEGGLRYRLRMRPGASAADPDRLVIWMHPAGGSMNDTVERLAPKLAAAKWALLVLTQKRFVGWTGDDAERLFQRTLPEVAAIDGIDAARPVVLGYSAGGQMALEYYYQKPASFGGLVLDAAYPVRIRGGAVSLDPVDPPTGPDAAGTPLYVLVGTKDGGARVWHKAAPAWRAAGVPLTLEYVPEKPHTWLFGKDQVARLLAWLGRVAAGEMPSGTVGSPPGGN